MNQNQYTILNLLADRQEHTGDEIGSTLGITRSAVQKHIQGLITIYGVKIQPIPGKGYRLQAPIEWLNHESIQKLLIQKGYSSPVDIHQELTSTNDFLLQQLKQIPLTKGHCVTSEFQSQGKGRRGRTWVSPIAANLYFTLYWRFDNLQAAMGLSLVIGLAVKAAIEQLYTLDIQLKWPNDIYLAQKKLGGILIELEANASDYCDVVIGVGLNTAMQQSHNATQQTITQPWSDLSSHVEQLDRSQLLAQLIISIQQYLIQFEQQGFSTFIADWNAANLYHQQKVTLTTPEKSTIGTCVGVDDQGGLILSLGKQQQAFYGGEISLRPTSS